MGDPLADAREAGDVPQAPGFLGWTAVMGAGAGLVFSVAGAAWSELAAASWGLGGGEAALDAALSILLSCVSGTLVGALVGLFVGAAAMGAVAPGLRARTRGPASRRGFGLAALFCVGVGALLLPGLMAKIGGGDPGILLAYTPLGALVLGGLALTPVALWDRARGLSRWRTRLLPEDRPRDTSDGLRPELRAALNRRARVPLMNASSLSVVVTADEYVVGLVFAEGRAPRVMRHGGFFLRQAAVDAGVAVVENAVLAHALAAVPTGDPAPASTWPMLMAISADRPPIHRTDEPEGRESDSGLP